MKVRFVWAIRKQSMPPPPTEKKPGFWIPNRLVSFLRDEFAQDNGLQG